MESYEQFNSRHRVKFDRERLDRSQREKRYEDYVASTESFRSGNRESRERVRADPYRQLASTPAARRANTNLESFVLKMRESKRQALEQYLHALQDYTIQGARQPSASQFPSVTAQIKTPFEVTTDANGRFCMFVRDDIMRHRLDSFTDLGSGQNGFKFTPGVGWSVLGGALDNSLNPVKYTNYTPIDKYAAIQSVYSGFRTVSMGVEVEYAAEPTNAKGRLCGGIWHPNTTNPSDIKPELFEAFQETQYATTAPAIDGMSVRWIPMGRDVTNFRLTKLGGQDTSFWVNLFHNSECSPDFNWAMFFASWNLAAGVPLTYNAGAGTFNVIDEPAVGFLMDGSVMNYSPQLYIVGEGLPPNTLVYTGYAYWNMELVADESTFHPGAITHSGVVSVTPDAQSTAAAVQSSVIPIATPKSSGAGAVMKKALGAAVSGVTSFLGVESLGKAANKLLSGDGIAFEDVMNVGKDIGSKIAQAASYI